LQAGSAAKGFGIDVSKRVHPIDGQEFRIAVDAYALMSLRGGIGRFFSEPENSALFALLQGDEASLASGGLQVLKFFHRVFIIGAFRVEGLYLGDVYSKNELMFSGPGSFPRGLRFSKSVPSETYIREASGT